MDNLLEELNKDLKPIEKPFKKPESLYNLYDFLFPGGKLAKLVIKPIIPLYKVLI